MDIFDLTDRVALVTGGGTGIGLAMAKGLASKGAHVILASRRGAVVEAAAADIQRSGGNAEGIVLDVTKLDMINTVVQRIHRDRGRLDILINNVGWNQRMSCLDMDPEIWDRILRTNLTGQFFCAQAAARLMRERQYGKIINVASVHSEMAGRNGAAYAASKGGVRQMTKALAVELAPYRISVNAIGPGTFPTDMTREQFGQSEWVKHQHARIPMGRVGRLEELAGAAIFFASSASDYVTGQILYVDGGYLSAL
jgi:NAD(P)-dependent dehydrogenase (short-subunit alcohol dehydrogenase family)